MPPPTCDVLILGSGLAGLRAAWAAAEADPRGRVLLATAGRGPSGSSFTNPNARLGFLAPQDPATREDAARRILELAPPGAARPELARILAREAAGRLADLETLGVPLARDATGAPVLHHSCFAPDLRCAVQLTDLPRTHALLMERTRSLNVEVLEGYTALSILADPEHGTCGALLAPTGGGPALAVRAGAVVAALGGPAPLFAANLCGSGGTGWSYALLARAGAELANAGFVQFFWSDARDGSFVNPARLARDGARILAPDGGEVALPPDMAALAASRAGHAPASWGLADRALDRLLARHAGGDGGVGLRLGGRETRVLARAHCGNGGALVDADSATTVPGLFAAGECATGMHGADRLGGAMVAATQVFGARAGRAAMRRARDGEQISDASFSELTKIALPFTRTQAPDTPAPLPAPLGAKALEGDKQFFENTIESIEASLQLRAPEAPRPDLESALTVARSLHKII
ncbi:FAD-binding protein [Desulfocurvus sp. DL9XJH121]